MKIRSRTAGQIKIRKAEHFDINSIFNLIDPFVKKEILLPRSKQEITYALDLTWVLEYKQKIVATSTLVHYDKQMVEIRALAVKESSQKQGFGGQLVDYICKEIKKSRSNPITVFALTYSPEFFLNLGMKIVGKDKFPQKIFEVCMSCSKLYNCSEVAVEKVI